MSLVCLDCDAVTIARNDTIQYSSTLFKVWVSPIACFLISYLFDVISMKSCTADRSPPTVMSSPCTVATMSCPLMHPHHTHGHAIHRVNLRSLSVDASSSSQFCAASRLPYKLYCSRPHMCSSPGWWSSCGSSTNTLLRAGA